MTSKRMILTILTLLTLTFAGFAVAQSTNDQGTVDQSDAALQPGVKSVTGLVSSFEHDRLVVRTEDGERTFMVLASTSRPATLQANAPVIVNYVSESGGDRAVRIAENTQYNAASQTPGGQVSGSDEWPGAANKDDEDNNAADSAGDDSMDHGSMEHHDSMADQSASAGTSDTTASTGDQGTTATGSVPDEDLSASSADTMSGRSGSSALNDRGTSADTTGTLAHDDTMEDSADQSAGMTGTTGTTTTGEESMEANADQSAGTAGTTDTTAGDQTATGSTYDRGTTGTYAGETETADTDTDTMAASDQSGYAGGDTLPQTGSELPLLGLIGLLALAAAAALHFGRNA